MTDFLAHFLTYSTCIIVLNYKVLCLELRPVPPFVPVHMFCTSWNERRNSFFTYYYKEQELLKSKQKIGGNLAFSEIIELKFGAKMPYIIVYVQYFKAF